LSATRDPDDPSAPKTIPPSSSGSIDVSFSGPIPAASDDDDPALSRSGRVAVEIGAETTGRSRRITAAAKETLGTGVEKLGAGIGTIGEGVSKLGEVSRRVPIVGASVSKLGEGITSVGESLHDLPRVARTRRGRLLVRSLIVGYLIVAAWVAAIVALQLHGNDTPDFRPMAERVLVELSKGTAGIEDVYDGASPRFQEMVRKERFVDDMSDLVATVGTFQEITAINDTLVTNGPTGRVGRVSMTVAFENATCRASVSLHVDQGRWKLLGIGVELPPEMKITQAQRQQRVQACADPMSKSCDLFERANEILEQLRDGKAGEVWDAATSVFQKQEERSRFIQLAVERAQILGNYSRIIAVTEAKVIGGTNATFDVITEYARSSGVRVIFGFYRRSKANPWKLRSFKVVVPMPRADEQPLPAPPAWLDPLDDEPAPSASQRGG
jgi:hypothetical protein